tara:strand:- start:86 stop:283 length:198 start_codon:yes stop_codon:yes gene_type:complete
MRNRNLITRKLETLDATLVVLTQIVNRQSPIETYMANITKAQGLVEDLKEMVEGEPLHPRELNKF